MTSYLIMPVSILLETIIPAKNNSCVNRLISEQLRRGAPVRCFYTEAPFGVALRIYALYSVVYCGSL